LGANTAGANATPGTINTGSGGGGSCGGAPVGLSGQGGSGVVIIKYANTLPDITTIAVGLTYTRTTPTGFKVYTFTAGTGSITI
jgi:hypothetical protein